MSWHLPRPDSDFIIRLAGLCGTLKTERGQSMRPVAVVGIGKTPFGAFRDRDLRSLGVEAGQKCLENAGARPSEVEAFYLGNFAGPSFAGQNHLAPYIAGAMGIEGVPATRLEAACASGGSAFFHAFSSVAAGLYDVVLVTGVEKMTSQPTPRVSEILAGAGDLAGEIKAGATFAALFAMIARRHMHQYGTTREQMAAVAVKNHANAFMNPYAHMRKLITLEQALAGKLIAEPLTIYDCSLISDGAASVLLAPLERAAEFAGKPVLVAGIAQTSGPVALDEREDITTFAAVRKAAERAYKMAGVTAAEIQFAELPGAVEKSWEIAEQCGLELVFADDKGGRLHFPDYPLPPGFTSADEFLRHSCEEGAKKHYGELSDQVTRRLDHELQVIRQKGFATYFLIVADVVRYAKESGILVGPGRGSAAGSLASFVLGITELDPLRYGLIFERFLNPGREEPPDIDIDFPDNRREEVVGYVKRRYGAENVAQIVTFARMNARAVVRDVGRVMGLPYGEMDRLAKMIQGGPASTLAQGLETQEVKAAIESNRRLADLLTVARSLEGGARHASKHAAGIVIAPSESSKGLRDFVPLLRLEEGQFVTQFDMDGIKYLGLLKIDLLGLRTLTVLDETRRLVKRTRERDIDYRKLPLDDPQTYSVFSEGRTDGIFQFESSGMRDALRKLKPDRLEDLIALNALYRPGPMEQIDLFIRRHRGVEPPAYFVPELEPILKETYGIVVYQEQVLRIVNELAGYDMGKADDFRRSMGKKRADIMVREQNNFVEGAARKGIPKEKAGTIFEFLEKFAGYGFNRSHSAAYALLAYRTAYLKTHYPIEFMAALLTSELGDQDKIAEYAGECRKLKLIVLPPDINRSQAHFSVEAAGPRPGNGKGGGGDGKPGAQAIRFGLAAVRNVGVAAAQNMIRIREQGGDFRSIFDFCERVDSTVVNRKAAESLVKCGAFDSLGRREQLLAVLGQAVGRGSRRQDESQSGQESLFSAAEVEAAQVLPEVGETLEHSYLSYEKEILGCYVSGHPLAEYEQEVLQFSTQSLKPEKLDLAAAGARIRVAGIAGRVKRGLTKKKETFARFQLEDLEGTIEALAWPDVLKSSGECLANGAILMATGHLQKPDESRPTLIVREMMPLEEAQVRLTREVHLKVNTVGTDESVLVSIKEVAALSPGSASLFLHFRTLHHGDAVLEASPSFKVKPTRELISQFKAILGDDAVSLSETGYVSASP